MYLVLEYLPIDERVCPYSLDGECIECNECNCVRLPDWLFEEKIN